LSGEARRMSSPFDLDDVGMARAIGKLSHNPSSVCHIVKLALLENQLVSSEVSVLCRSFIRKIELKMASKFFHVTTVGAFAS
jgi:hypothetical protein